MGRLTTKTDLLTTAATNYEKLNTPILGLTKKFYDRPLYSFGDGNRKCKKIPAFDIEAAQRRNTHCFLACADSAIYQ